MDLVGKPIEAGMLIPVKSFEELLGFDRTDQAFGWLISGIRHKLYEHGIYLSGEGLSQTGGYEILAPRDNAWIAKLAVARADRDLEGKQTLLLNTSLESLSNLEKARHENTLREISMKLNAMRRAEEVDEILKRKRKKEAPPADEEAA